MARQPQGPSPAMLLLADSIALVMEGGVYLTALAPPLLGLWLMRGAHPALLLPAAVGAYFVSALLFVGAIIFTKRVLIGAIPNGRYLLTSPNAVRWMFADRLCKIATRGPFHTLLTQHLVFRQLYHRGMGAQIDGTLMMGPNANISEPWLFRAGRNVLVGSGAAISGHKVEHRVLCLDEVVVGDNVLIGARCIIFPGVKIGDNAVVGANSVIPRGTVIGDGERWAGNPATRLETLVRAPALATIAARAPLDSVPQGAPHAIDHEQAPQDLQEATCKAS